MKQSYLYVLVTVLLLIVGMWLGSLLFPAEKVVEKGMSQREIDSMHLQMDSLIAERVKLEEIEKIIRQEAWRNRRETRKIGDSLSAFRKALPQDTIKDYSHLSDEELIEELNRVLTQ